MPIQVKRLLIAFALFFIVFFILVYFLFPESWGDIGPYRSLALKEIADKEPKYVDTESCTMCHDSIANLKNDGEHKSINCQTCHGVGYKHVNEPETNKMDIPKGRDFCARCHALNAARPKNIIKQVDIIEHNKGEECLSCHNPHKPWL
ncbi:MAG: hypothetical protein COZ21_12195 [Bacteroidetes bacterium CG_4_10_14_3_um_filter_31_20]|nr:MAG: hypothetical protein COZ21_12195 [Bacteroidetes bacterium CG_4_10_14_3_um_filter_31_20]